MRSELYLAHLEQHSGSIFHQVTKNLCGKSHFLSLLSVNIIIFLIILKMNNISFFFQKGSPPNSPEGSTSSERDFRRRYQAVTHRMVHRRASAEMFERLAARTFGEFRSSLLIYVFSET